MNTTRRLTCIDWFAVYPRRQFAARRCRQVYSIGIAKGNELRTSSRNVRRRIVFSRALAQQRGACTRNRLPGVGLSSSAESTAHQSNRDIKSDQ
ncbi:hypothetical protein CGZ80_23200 [Rhodopirellula sp. MGV]|nr:hypothetical protein CGZ80_23200 [Rhodopirellula sp. MGV]PNY37574.1 hypothetical protein C2E31_07035 [Rhodopirellula baltica]